jgi:hypothetical protein
MVSLVECCCPIAQIIAFQAVVSQYKPTRGYVNSRRFDVWGSFQSEGSQGEDSGQLWPSLVIGAALAVCRFMPLRFPFVPPVARRFCTGRYISGGEDEGRGHPWRLPLVSRFSRTQAVSPASRRGTSSSSTGNWIVEVRCWILITGFQSMRCLPLFSSSSHGHRPLLDGFWCRLIVLRLPGIVKFGQQTQRVNHLSHRPHHLDSAPQPLPYRGWAHVVEGQLP